MTPPEADIHVLVHTPAASRASRGPRPPRHRDGDARARILARGYARYAAEPVTRIALASFASTSTARGAKVTTKMTTTTTETDSSSLPTVHRQVDTTVPVPGSTASMQLWSMSFGSVCDNLPSPRVAHAHAHAQAHASTPSTPSTTRTVHQTPAVLSPAADTTVCDPSISWLRAAAEVAAAASGAMAVDGHDKALSAPSTSDLPSPPLPDLPPRRPNYVSPDDCIPDSQPDHPAQHAHAKNDTKRTPTVCDSDRVTCTDGATPVSPSSETDDAPRRPFGSPDLSAMPLLPSPKLPRMRLLSQTPANETSSPGSHVPSSFPDEAVRMSAVAVDLGAPAAGLFAIDGIDGIDGIDIDDIDIDDIDDTVLVPTPPICSWGDAPLAIFSPEPPVSVDCLDAVSVVPERLAELAGKMDLARRFTRVAVYADPHKEPGPFDRGCWRLDTTTLSDAHRHNMWRFLAAYIGRGDAGWSVWASRDAADDPCVRLHCFAAMAGHAYLLLYLASQRTILATGAIWVDAAGANAITVPARRQKRVASRSGKTRSRVSSDTE